MLFRSYNTGKYKKYYPSNNTDVEKEITYYTEAPSEGYVKDESTKAKAYKYFKQEEGTETVPTNDWIAIGSDYLNLDELLEVYNKYGFKVKTLQEIEKNEDIRYEISIRYRNRK